MLHVLLDSTVYRQDPQRKKAGFQTLRKLFEQRAVALHIPSIVRGEFVSHFSDMAEKTLSDTVRSVKELQSINDPTEAKAVVDKILTELNDLKGLYANDIENRFDEWAKTVGASVEEVRPDCMHEVLDQYFRGEGPFKKIKSREDFPDAFIWHIIKDLASRQKLYVVSDDNNFRQAIAELPNVEVFENLDAFIESETVQELFPDNFVRKNADTILRLIEAEKGYLEDELLGLMYGELARSHLEYRDDESADIVDVSGITTADFDFFGARQYGPDLIRVPFDATVEVTVDYLLLKSTYYEMPESQSESISIDDADWNESFMHVTEELTLEVTGVLAIEIDARAVIAALKDERLTWDGLRYNCHVSLDRLDRLTIQDAYEL